VILLGVLFVIILGLFILKHRLWDEARRKHGLDD